MNKTRRANPAEHHAIMITRRDEQRSRNGHIGSVPVRPNERRWQNARVRECARRLRQLERNHRKFIARAIS